VVVKYKCRTGLCVTLPYIIIAAGHSALGTQPGLLSTTTSIIMKPRDYCCCAIPLVNPGIYTVIAEQFVLGVVLGLLSFTTPSSGFFLPPCPQQRLPYFFLKLLGLPCSLHHR
jgi:hypothetical protein